MTAAGPPTKPGPLQQREARLAFGLLLPTVLIVAAIVAFPLIANFWISFKPVGLAELRAPEPIVQERVRGKAAAAGDELEVEYRIRNPSSKHELTNVFFSDAIPEGFAAIAVDGACTSVGSAITCAVGRIEPRSRIEIPLLLAATEDLPDPPPNPRATKPEASGDATNVLTSLDFTFSNFLVVFSARDFWNVLWVSLAYTIFGTVGALLLGLFAALLLHHAFRGRGLLRGLFLFPYVAPVIAVAFTWIILLDPFSGTVNGLLTNAGVFDSPVNFFGSRYITFDLFGLQIPFPLALASVIAFESWRYFPLAFLFILARMQSINAEMFEAAEVDGASPIQQFSSILLPQLAGIISVLFLLRFIWTFNKFDDIFLLTGGAAGTRTLVVNVYEQAFAISNLGAGAACAVMVFIVLALFAAFYFRFQPKGESL